MLLPKSFKNKTINIVTHNSSFHADDIFATAFISLYLDNDYKYKIKRSIDKKDIEKADIVYDIGSIYDIKKLRFDHHQKDGAGERFDAKYAAFGLVFKYFGLETILKYNKINKFKLNKIEIQKQFDIIDKKLIRHIDSMDNGYMTYKNISENIDVFTIDSFFECVKLSCNDNSKEFDKKFFEMVKIAKTILIELFKYSAIKVLDIKKAEKYYQKAKDKRAILCDEFVSYNFNNFIEPLVMIFPHSRGGFAAKNIRKKGDDYDARFYFPEAWRGYKDEELENITGVKDALFCHNSGFLLVSKDLKSMYNLLNKAFEILNLEKLTQ